MTPRIFAATCATATLVLAACGGSDGGEAGGGNLLGGDSDLDIGEQILENNGLDIDDLDLDGDGDGDLDLEDIAELENNASNAIDSLANGSGNATITIAGVPYELGGGSCFDFGSNLSLDGAGVGPDGQPFWGEVSYTVNNRAEMADAGFDEAFLEQMFGDRQEAVDFSVSVEIGKTDRFESAPDGSADYSADVFMGEAFFGTVNFEKNGSTLTGSGDMIDDNGVAAEYGELIPFDVVASCG